MEPRSQLRKMIRKRRNALSAAAQEQAGIALKENLSRHHKIQQASRIAIYLNNDGELSTVQFIEWC